MRYFIALLCFLPFTALSDDFTISDADVAKLSKADIVATVKHLISLSHDQEKIIEFQKSALASSFDQTLALQKQINSLAQQAAADHDKVLAQQAAILRRDLIILVMGLAAGVYLFLKLYLHLPI